jgi:hypothetical protein
METALNAFERGGRERRARDRGERGERGRGVGVDLHKHPILLNLNYNHYQS